MACNSWYDMWHNYPVGTFWLNRRLNDNLCTFYKNTEDGLIRCLYNIFDKCSGMERDKTKPIGWETEIFSLNSLQYLNHIYWEKNYYKTAEHKKFFQEAVEWLVKQHT